MGLAHKKTLSKRVTLFFSLFFSVCPSDDRARSSEHVWRLALEWVLCSFFLVSFATKWTANPTHAYIYLKWATRKHKYTNKQTHIVYMHIYVAPQHIQKNPDHVRYGTLSIRAKDWARRDAYPELRLPGAKSQINNACYTTKCSTQAAKKTILSYVDFVNFLACLATASSCKIWIKKIYGYIAARTQETRARVALYTNTEAHHVPSCGMPRMCYDIQLGG